MLTVGQLQHMLANVEPSTFVVLATNGWYDHVGSVELPDGEEFMCVTLFHGTAWDARDL
jgi:hypothetical protein